MASNKNPVLKRLWAIGLCQMLVLVPGMAVQAESQAENVLVSQAFTPPGPGTPDQTAGGASRGDATWPIALLPTRKEGLTVAERPTFLVYVPETAAKQAVFILRDKNEDYYYQKTLSIVQTGGIMAINLPESAPVLEMNTKYNWSMILVPEGGLEPDSPGVKGIIMRVESTARSSPAAQTWYDRAANLAKMRREQPSDRTVAEKWEKLLASVGLHAIASVPILE
ncbi:MAG: DUF928 domain-containing protein [Hormoscilla sp.]